MPNYPCSLFSLFSFGNRRKKKERNKENRLLFVINSIMSETLHVSSNLRYTVSLRSLFDCLTHQQTEHCRKSPSFNYFLCSLVTDWGAEKELGGGRSTEGGGEAGGEGVITSMEQVSVFHIYLS